MLSNVNIFSNMHEFHLRGTNAFFSNWKPIYFYYTKIHFNNKLKHAETLSLLEYYYNNLFFCFFLVSGNIIHERYVAVRKGVE